LRFRLNTFESQSTPMTHSTAGRKLEVDFCKWWQTNYRTTNHPAYIVCKKLYEAQADVIYLSRLCYHFASIISMQDRVYQNMAGRRRASEIRFRFYQGMTNEDRQVFKDIIEPLNRSLNKIYSRNYRVLQKEALQGSKRELIQKWGKRKVQRTEKELVTEILEDQALFKPFEHLVRSPKPGRGRKAHLFGPFMLLAVSEHLRQTGR
jgi:hypothetical protein